MSYILCTLIHNIIEQEKANEPLPVKTGYTTCRKAFFEFMKPKLEENQIRFYSIPSNFKHLTEKYKQEYTNFKIEYVKKQIISLKERKKEAYRRHCLRRKALNEQITI